MKRYILDHAINRAECPELIGKTVKSAPEGALSRPVIRCCGADLLCDGFTNTCPHCETDFNFAGQMLAPRSQWGEETGEHWSECY